MIRDYVKVAWRNLRKNRLFSIINIAGLSVGMASTILLLGYVSFQLSYDRFNHRSKDIYRVTLDFYENHKLIFGSAENYSGLASALKQHFPEIENAARLYNMGYKNNCVFTYQNQSYKETKFLYADPSIFSIFTFPFVHGDPANALEKPNSAVISESLAKKIYGDENPMGKSIQMDDDDRNSELCTISGVFKDIPSNSHLKFNILISFSTLDHRKGGANRYETNWNRKDFYTYVLLQPGTDAEKLEAKMPAFAASQIPDENQRNQRSVFHLEPLTSIHLNSNLDDEAEPNGNAKIIWFLVIIAAFTATVAWVNFINLSIAGAADRSREIGVRKVLGSSRSQLVKQFITESSAVILVSLMVALTITGFVRPWLWQRFSIDFPLLKVFANRFGASFLIFLLLGTLLSSLYPALVLSASKPALIIKGSQQASSSRYDLRKILVVFQFSLAILLIAGTVIVSKQVHFMLNQSLGFHSEQVLVLNRPGRWDKSDSINSLRVLHFKELLMRNPSVESVAMSNEVPGKPIRSQIAFVPEDNPSANSISLNTMGVDEDYMRALGIQIIAGRNFSPKFASDEDGLVVTAAASQLFGFAHPEDAIGKRVVQGKEVFTIVGVAEDFHHLSLDRRMEPVAFMYNGRDYEADEYYLVKLKSENYSQSIQEIRSVWNEVFLGDPMDYFFLDQFFNLQYQHVNQFGALFGSFSLITEWIASIGLLALVAFVIKQRTKEIGVRKVLGAGMKDITLLLTGEFAKLILLANLIAIPIGWLMFDNWLKDFAYHIRLNAYFFILAGLTALLLAMLTICFLTIKAAIASPINSLRDE